MITLPNWADAHHYYYLTTGGWFIPHPLTTYLPLTSPSKTLLSALLTQSKAKHRENNRAPVGLRSGGDEGALHSQLGVVGWPQSRPSPLLSMSSCVSAACPRINFERSARRLPNPLQRPSLLSPSSTMARPKVGARQKPRQAAIAVLPKPASVSSCATADPD